MVGNLQKIVEPVILIGRAEHMSLAAHFFFAKARFMQAAGRGTTEHLANLRIALVHAERFLRQQNARAAFVHHIL